ncbi:MAG TPA: ABC transporter substrate-binding protein [Candidatus Binatia bacterium]|jgi:ABC-type nitrate/sulfonate/bicarbonate transport system substrate-binding protein|nr:ABC transporter substrate-binding protein [Candidatus Binatia bacterium]
MLIKLNIESCMSGFHIVRISGAILLAIVISSAALAQQSLDRIVITYPSRSIASVDLYIAQDRGFFRQEGLLADVVQVRGNIGVTALLSGDAHAINNVGTIIRAMERTELPAKVVSQSLKKNLFWLVTKPEVKSLSELKGKVFGTTTMGGSQHLAGIRLLQKAGLDPDKDITVVIGGDVPAQLQSLVSGVIHLAALSPPTVILARDKFKLRIHGSTLDDLPNLQNGLAFSDKLLRERRELVKRILRARSRAHRYFWENERGTAEVLANYLKVDLAVALESYRLARPAFTAIGLPTDKEVEDFLRADAAVLKLKEPVPAAKIFDFSLQREVNQELGLK